MAPAFIRIVWGNPPVPAGRWHGGLLNLKFVPKGSALARSGPCGPDSDPWRAFRAHRIHLSLRGACLWTLALVVLLHLAGSFALQRHLERSSAHNRVSYADLALPWRWKQLDRLRGETLVADGRALLTSRRFSEGFALLRQGLERHPADSGARLEIARTYVAMRLAPQARKLLRDGLALGYPGRDSVEFALALALDADAPAERIELCRLARARFDELPGSSRVPTEAAWLDLQLARALRADGRAGEALALLRAGQPPDSPLRLEAEARAAMEEGSPAEAAAIAESWAAKSPRDPEPLRLLAEARLAAKDPEGAAAAFGRLRALEPGQPRPLVFAYALLLAHGHVAAARAEIDELVLRHGARPALYETLAAVLPETKDETVLSRIEHELAERGLSPRPALRARIQIASDRRDWPAVLTAAESLRTSPGPGLPAREKAWLETMTRLARACLDGGSGVQAALVEIVADHPGALRLYRTVVEALLDASRPATALRVLALAEGPLPSSVTLGALRARADAALTPAHAAPVPSPEPESIASENAFTAACSDHLRKDGREAALALLAELRRARPAWLAGAESRVDALELSIRARGDDPLRLQFLARASLDRDPSAPGKLLALARTIHAESPSLRPNALLLAREIARHSPGHADTLAQLAEWAPRTEPEPAP